MSSFRPLIGDMPVGDHLPSLRPAGRKPEAGDHVVEPAFEQRHQGVAGIAGPAAGQLEILAELPLEDPVIPLDLLLLAEPDRVFANLHSQSCKCHRTAKLMVAPAETFCPADGDWTMTMLAGEG